MKDSKTRKVYQAVNLIGAVICGLLLASFFAWLSASDELKHPCAGDAQVPCLASFGVTFQYFLKQYLLVCLGSFLLAYIIQFVISLRYFSKLSGILIGFIGIIFFSLFTFNFFGKIGYQDTPASIIIFNVVLGLAFVLVMGLILSPFFVYEISNKRKFIHKRVNQLR